MATLRVLLAGNRAKLRRLWHAALDQTPDVQIVDEATNGKELRQQLARTDFDLVLVDSHMPHVQGQDIPSLVAQFNSHVATMVFTVCTDTQTVFIATHANLDHALITGVGMPRALEIIRAIAPEQRNHRNVKIHG